jgi:hypothetical protein
MRWKGSSSVLFICSCVVNEHDQRHSFGEINPKKKISNFVPYPPRKIMGFSKTMPMSLGEGGRKTLLMR